MWRVESKVVEMWVWTDLLGWRPPVRGGRLNHQGADGQDDSVQYAGEEDLDVMRRLFYAQCECGKLFSVGEVGRCGSRR